MIRRLALAALTLPLLSACADDGLTREEAREAVDQVSMSEQALTVSGGTVEIATNFTIGQAVQQAAEELLQFFQDTLPCAEITHDGATLSVEYGKLSGNCTYKGLTYTGRHEITVQRNDDGDVLVDHEWTELSNGRMSVSGTANVTWSFIGGSRHVVHSLDWTRLSDGKTAHGGGDRLQTVLEGGLFEGIQVDGQRSWDGASGHWGLDIDGIEVRWIDPVPQSGVYTLDTPFEKTVTITFERVDSVTIRVTVSDGANEFEFNVKSLPG